MLAIVSKTDKCLYQQNLFSLKVGKIKLKFVKLERISKSVIIFPSCFSGYGWFYYVDIQRYVFKASR